MAVFDVAGYHHASQHGGSRSLVFQLADGRLALVKFKANPQSTRALVGDLVGTRLGNHLGAAFAEPLLVHVGLDRLQDIPVLRYRPWSPGLQFATIFHPDAVPIERRAARRLTNLDRLPVTALVEVWLYNVDLKPSHLMARGDELLVVDHGHVLPDGPGWSKGSLRWGVGRAPDVSALTWLARASERAYDFAPALERCEAVTDEEIRRLIEEVPDEWGLDRSRARALHAFLCSRRRRLDDWARSLVSVWR